MAKRNWEDWLAKHFSELTRTVDEDYVLAKAIKTEWPWASRARSSWYGVAITVGDAVELEQGDLFLYLGNRVDCDIEPLVSVYNPQDPKEEYILIHKDRIKCDFGHDAPEEEEEEELW